MAPVATPQSEAQQPENQNEAKAQGKQSLDNLPKDAMNRIWRGNKEGTIKAEIYPDFWDKTDMDSLLKKRQHIKEHLVCAFRYWGKLGFGEGVAGHITVRDPIEPTSYWMNAFGDHFSTITVSKLVLVTEEGYVHPTIGAQRPINAAGFYIHSAIHKARPEIQAIGHCHSTYGKAWSAFGLPVQITNQDSCMFWNNQAVYKSFGGIVLAAEEGGRIAAALGPKNKCAILQNHGLLTLGDSVDECAYLFSALDKQCHIQLMQEAAEANGIKKVVIDDEDAKFTAATIQTPQATYFSFKGEVDLIKEREPQCLL